ncbi:MAG: hypothetical protein KDJ41_08540 [Hyphomicrobiaceae bacterium]|nr:hypothetical protein [Hyphomicrobiaceae bacterium]MCC0017414.1 hypothetical protein [Rhodobiaceae bacterium]
MPVRPGAVVSASGLARAEAAGWSEDEVAAALLELAHHHIQGIIADRKTKLDIEAAARSVM